MTQWEYLSTKEEALANECGREGWELVTVSEPDALGVRTFYFKRQVEKKEMSDEQTKAAAPAAKKPTPRRSGSGRTDTP